MLFSGVGVGLIESLLNKKSSVDVASGIGVVFCDSLFVMYLVFSLF